MPKSQPNRLDSLVLYKQQQIYLHTLKRMAQRVNVQIVEWEVTTLMFVQ